MKRVLVSVLLILFLCSCGSINNESQNQRRGNGIWISYYEINTMLKSEKGFKKEFETVIENCKKLNITDIYIHIRAFCDSLYKSDYFPQMENAKKYDYDIFSHILQECHKANLKVYAWINPYRVSTATSNINDLPKDSPAYITLKDNITLNDTDICFANGIYLNPASLRVRQLILDGIRELIVKYEVDGIHFDDYFYPTTKKDFDTASYIAYKKTVDIPLSLADWRRENVNLLISSCYNTIKYANKDIIFSISPAASVESNYDNLYADVNAWIKGGYIDEIIPQLYFGFEYPDENFRFENLITTWKDITSLNSKVKLKIGLANYKAKPDLEADIDEWTQNSDIIARQMKICEKDKDIDGVVFFSYSAVFSEEAAFKNQTENIIKYLKDKENE